RAQRLGLVAKSGVDLDHETDGALVADRHSLDHVGGDHVAARGGIDDLRQRVHDIVAAGRHSVSPVLITPSTVWVMPSSSTVSTTVACTGPDGFRARTASSICCCEVTPTCLRNLRIDMLKASFIWPLPPGYVVEWCRGTCLSRIGPAGRIRAAIVWVPGRRIA